MIKALYNALLEWYRSTDDRQKMQHAYVAIVVASVIVAGLVSLLDGPTGQDLLMVTTAAGGIFLANAVVWSLLDSIVLGRLSGRRKKQ